MVVISERSIETLLDELIPKIEWLTQWNSHLDGLEIKIIKNSQLWKYAMKPQFDAMEFDAKPKGFIEEIAMDVMKTLIPYLPLGVYEPNSNSLILLAENMSDISKSAFSIVVGHELVHRCQHANNPLFFENLKNFNKELGIELYKIQEKLNKKYGLTIRESFRHSYLYNALKKIHLAGDIPEDPVFEEYQKLMNNLIVGKLQSFMTLTEGDAYFVQNQLKRMFYQDAESLRSPVRSFVLDILAEYIPVIKAKLEQYPVGEAFIKQTYTTYRRKAVNQLYQLDKKNLHKKITKFKNGLREKNASN